MICLVSMLKFEQLSYYIIRLPNSFTAAVMPWTFPSQIPAHAHPLGSCLSRSDNCSCGTICSRSNLALVKSDLVNFTLSLVNWSNGFGSQGGFLDSHKWSCCLAMGCCQTIENRRVCWCALCSETGSALRCEAESNAELRQQRLSCSGDTCCWCSWGKEALFH